MWTDSLILKIANVSIDLRRFFSYLTSITIAIVLRDSHIQFYWDWITILLIDILTRVFAIFIAVYSLSDSFKKSFSSIILVEVD
jgi:hypothetical protein